MNILSRIFNPFELKHVFTPNVIAKLTYIERETLENDLSKYLDMPGKQIVLYGHSGGGKTTLIRNQLKLKKKNFIRTHCEGNTTFDSIILNAFDSLGRYYTSQRSGTSSVQIKSELKGEYGLIKSKIQASETKTIGEVQQLIVPPQLTAQKLANFLGEINCVWIIEDFHKVSSEEKKRIADVVKIFIDSANDFPEVKIICIGAVGTARELIELDDNLNTRISELFVPLLRDDEILEVIQKGCKLLNVKMSSELEDKIVYYSNNLASLCHQMCFDICHDKGVMKTKMFKEKINDEKFKVAIDSFVRKNSDTFSKMYDSICSQSLGKFILKAFDVTEKEFISIGEIKNYIRRFEKINELELSEALEKLGTIEFDELVRYDRNSKKYSISTPFFRAFLKMKFALEEKENKERLSKKAKKRMKKYSIKENKRERLVIDVEFMENYYQLLDSYIIRERRKEK